MALERAARSLGRGPARGPRAPAAGIAGAVGERASSRRRRAQSSRRAEELRGQAGRRRSLGAAESESPRFLLGHGSRRRRGALFGLDPTKREVTTARGERLRYDVLSLDTGSSAGEPAGATDRALRVRPVEAFLAGWERLRESARNGEVRRIAVVGGGAAGVEVLLAMRHGLAGSATQFALFSELPVLAGHGARRRIARILGERGVTVHSGRKVLAAGENGLELDGGGRFGAQAAVWAAGAYAPSWIARSALAIAAGDVASVIGEPGPKSGVFAVRQGPVLAHNLRRALAGEAPERFRPPSRSLALISCGDRYAVASWGWLALEGAWVWRWKDRIDRRFVERYRLGPGEG
ncbi:MAG: pyridine nucleotide-disulfide oxidoreductase [Betaproteobacteria bacterium]|nr:MAG: pyridine nucleotide-disulfide oxidoreductase [Betaproteobacteria bacterium]